MKNFSKYAKYSIEYAVIHLYNRYITRKKGVNVFMSSYNDIMTFEGLPGGLVGSIMAAIDDFCLSVCVPAVDDLSKAPPLKWLSCMAYVGRVCTVKYVRLLHNVYDKVPKDNKTPAASAPILNDNTPEGVRRGLYDLVPCYIWLCGLYNKIVTPEGFSNFCGYPVGVDGLFLGADHARRSRIIWSDDGQPFAEPKEEGESTLYNSTYTDNNSPTGESFQDSFGFCDGSADDGGRGESLARWKEELKQALKARKAEAVESTLTDSRYPTIMLDARKAEKAAEIIEKVAPAALSLADLPRLK